MAKTPTINVPVTVNLSATLARELREAADKLDPSDHTVMWDCEGRGASGPCGSFHCATCGGGR